MRTIDKISRAIAFYFSVLLFCVLLPIILSYALGYKIDYRHLKVYKTGILYISSRPSGASIFINGEIHPSLTPAQIEELKPGTYKVEAQKDGFYPWEKEMVVRPNMVTKADRIVLFPIAQEMKTISRGEIRDFMISDNGFIYYMKRSGLFRSDMDGGDLRRLSAYGEWPGDIMGKRFSADGNKILFFTRHKLNVLHLEPDAVKVDEVFTSHDPIIDAFWYPSAGYMIVVTQRDIMAVELSDSEKRNAVSLYKFNSRPTGVIYDDNKGSLYFIDTRIGIGSKSMSYLFSLDLKQKFFAGLMQLLIKKEQDAGYEKR